MKFKTKLVNMKPRACEPAIDWVGDRTEKQAWNECQRGDWMLWYYAKKHPHNIKKLTLAKGHCANTVRHLMTNKRSKDAVDTAIRFGEGKATQEELDKAAYAAYADAATPYDAAAYAAYASAYAAYASTAYVTVAYACYASAYAAAAIERKQGEKAKKKNQQETADICRKYLKI